MTDKPENFDEKFSRIQQMIGDEAFKKLSKSFVVIVGLGAVGGYALEGLCRSGVGHIRVVDFDIINPSNINRQLLATEATVGMTKAQAAAERARLINPDINIEPMEIFAHTESFDKILSGQPDIVIDAIDAMTPKAALMDECHRRRQTIISAMGAALRYDYSYIKIAPLSETIGCPLARAIRKKLRAMKSDADTMCIYSDEPRGPDAKKSLGPVVSGNDDFYDRGRKRRILGSLPTITGVFGLIAAQYAIDTIIVRKPHKG